jgi:hypothetical protein
MGSHGLITPPTPGHPAALGISFSVAESPLRDLLPAQRRERCACCRYDVRGADGAGTCPECGSWNPGWVGNPGPAHRGGWAALVAIAALVLTPVPLLSAGVASAGIVLGSRASHVPAASASTSDRFEGIAAVVLGLVILATDACYIACFLLRQ